MNPTIGLDLIEDGEDFILTALDKDGQPATLRLTESQILTLANSALSLEQRILSKRDARGGGAFAVMAIAVDQFRVQSDSMGQDLLLTVQSPNGRQLCFAFPPHHAARLAAEVPIEVAEMQKPTGLKPQ